MKYFEKIPKVSYETTIGSFSISDPFAFYEFNYDLVKKQVYNIDSKNTLIEAASIIYEDVNSFWVFLLSNQKTNPFTLLPNNIEIAIDNNQNKFTFNIEGSTLNQYIVVDKRTILVEYDVAAGSGDPTTFNGTGYFDYLGNIVLVESVDPFTKMVTTKPTKGNGEWSITSTSIDGLSVLNTVSGNTYNIVSTSELTTANKTKYEDSVKKSVTTDTGNVIVDSQYENITDDFTAVGSTTEEYTEKDILINDPKQINAFLPSELNKVLGTLIYVKYS